MKRSAVWKMARIAVLAVALPIVAPSVARAQLLDFAQMDLSKDTRSVVLVRALRDDNPSTPDPLISAVYARWNTGSTASLGYMHRWSLIQGTHSWLVGAGAGANTFRSRGSGQDNESALSLRGQTELLGPAPGGRYYALMQFSSFRGQVFAVAQYDLADTKLGFEVSRLVQTEYHQTGLALRYALDQDRRWFVRTGVVKTPEDRQVFIGLAYNGF